MYIYIFIYIYIYIYIYLHRCGQRNTTVKSRTPLAWALENRFYDSDDQRQASFGERTSAGTEHHEAEHRYREHETTASESGTPLPNSITYSGAPL